MIAKGFKIELFVFHPLLILMNLLIFLRKKTRRSLWITFIRKWTSMILRKKSKKFVITFIRMDIVWVVIYQRDLLAVWRFNCRIYVGFFRCLFFTQPVDNDDVIGCTKDKDESQYADNHTEGVGISINY